MLKKELKACSWGYFYYLTMDPMYETLTADNCCCGTCRELGWYNYDEMREIVKEIDQAILKHANDAYGLASKTALLDRIDAEERFRRGEFQSHLKSDSPVGRHCQRYLLSTHVDCRFSSPCTHEKGGHEEMPPTMEEKIQRSHQRRPVPSDWNDACEVCMDVNGLMTQSGGVLTCSHCCVVAHTECVKRTHFDLPQGKDSWTCWDCARRIGEVMHNSSCDECNEGENIIDDIRLGIDVLSALEPSIETQPGNTGAVDSGSGGIGSKSLVVGTRVTVLYKGHEGSQRNRYYAGTIRSVNADGTYNIMYDDNECEADVAREFINLVAPTTHTDSSSRKALASEMLRARLISAEAKMLGFHAHLIRDKNQDCFKEVMLEAMTINAFFCLSDYWAKLQSQKSATATCEGNQIGISAHGMMFIHRNLSLEERAEVDAKYGEQDWTQFGPATDEPGGLSFLEEHHAAISDDAKQNVFHTKSVIESCVQRFLSNKPWIDPLGRLGAHQSDNASNYRDPILVVDNPALGSHIFNEPGEGKNEGDSNGGNNKVGLRRLRDSSNQEVKHHQEDAGDYLADLNLVNVKANNYAKLVVERMHEDTGIAGRESTPREHLMWVVRKHNGGAGGGGGGGGVESAAAHDRFMSGAKAGQCKVKCWCHKVSVPTVVNDCQAQDRELELVKWEVI